MESSQLALHFAASAIIASQPNLTTGRHHTTEKKTSFMPVGHHQGTSDPFSRAFHDISPPPPLVPHHLLNHGAEKSHWTLLQEMIVALGSLISQAPFVESVVPDELTSGTCNTKPEPEPTNRLFFSFHQQNRFPGRIFTVSHQDKKKDTHVFPMEAQLWGTAGIKVSLGLGLVTTGTDASRSSVCNCN